MKPKILCVDDNVEFIEIIGLYFKQKGWEVELAADGREALEKFAVFMPDILLLDIVMPGLNGFQTLEIIREYLSESKHYYLPFILSFIEDGDTIEEALGKYRVIDYFVKERTVKEMDRIFDTVNDKYQRIIRAHKWSGALTSGGDIHSIISSRMHSGFTGTIDIFCNKNSYKLKFHRGRPVNPETGQQFSIDDLMNLLQKIKNDTDCVIKSADEATLRDIISARLGLFFKALSLYFGRIGLRFTVRDNKNDVILYTDIEPDFLKVMEALMDISNNWQNVLEFGSLDVEHFDFALDDRVVRRYQIDGRFELALSVPSDRWADVMHRLDHLIRVKMPYLQRILIQEVVT